MTISCMDYPKPYFYFAYAMALSVRSEYDEAIMNFKKAIGLKGDNPRYYDEYALAVYRKGDKYWKEGLELYKYALKISNPNVHYEINVIERIKRRINEKHYVYR